MINLSDSIEQIVEDIRANGEWIEGMQLEFKKAQGGVPKDIWPTYSAFANTEGGLIVLGVHDKGHILGLDNPQKMRKDIIDTANNLNKVSCNLIDNKDLVEVVIKGKSILVIRVRRADNSERPVILDNNGAECYRRNDSADQRCSDELRYQMIRDKDINSQDAVIISHTSFADFDPETISQYRNLMAHVNPRHQWLRESDEGFLRKVRAYAVDRKTGEQGVTLAGLLMFGSDDAIRELRPQYKVEYLKLLDKPTTEQRWLDRIYIDGNWHPNLFQFFHRVINKLEQNVQNPFSIPDKTIRSDMTLVHIAIREALANAIIHADYASSIGVRIEQSSRGIVLRNAGSLLLPKDTILQGGYTKCRNPLLQTMFSLIGISEKAGSGVDKLLKAWLDEYIAAPTVEELCNPVVVEWELPYAELLNRNKLNIIQNVLGEYEYTSLDFWQKLILLYLPVDQWYSRNELAKFIPIHPSDISRTLTKLVKEGHIISQGRSSSTTYQLAPKFLIPHEDAFLETQKEVPPISEPDLIDELSVDLQVRVVEYRKKKRHNPSLTHELILDIAMDRWVGLSDLSKLLLRKASVINKDFIQPMIRAKQMEHRYPQPHPRQEFKTIKKNGS